MGAQKSIHAGKAKIDLNVDLTHKLCGALLLPPPVRNSSDPFSQIIGRLCIKHPGLFGRSEKLDFLWDKGLHDSNLLIALRRPGAERFAQQSFVVQHSIAPEIGVHGLPTEHYPHSGIGWINLSRFSAGVELTEPATSNWSSSTSIRFEHVRPISNEGRSIMTDIDGLPITCSGRSHDNMFVLKQESQFATINENNFARLTVQMEQGLPLLSKWLIFNRFKFIASKGLRLGKALLVASLTGGSIVGDMAPYQAFAIGGPGSVRGYTEGAIGSGRSYLVTNNELTVPLAKQLEGALFMDYGTDLGSARLVPGHPALRQGKPGYGFGFGYGLRFNSKLGQLRLDYAMNAYNQTTLYFGVNNVGS
ncbi:Bacterial surface antigen (D15) domain-containing protein [Dioscorea alata]|uniref:Bacterial surface antigen (D15) domain-containing protein n=1 Tax=Dioscorea alata TaxID=55571 RepID=A0ACB7UMH6_DIOAL|nr:Bacterial surface antigen (D15) domain-containing protein [Dioscorea alata]